MAPFERGEICFIKLEAKTASGEMQVQSQQGEGSGQRAVTEVSQRFRNESGAQPSQGLGSLPCVSRCKGLAVVVRSGCVGQGVV